MLRLIPQAFTTDNFRRVLSSFPVATWFGNSVAIALVVAVITVSVSMLAGYAFAHLRSVAPDSSSWWRSRR